MAEGQKKTIKKTAKKSVAKPAQKKADDKAEDEVQPTVASADVTPGVSEKKSQNDASAYTDDPSDDDDQAGGIAADSLVPAQGPTEDNMKKSGKGKVKSSPDKSYARNVSPPKGKIIKQGEEPTFEGVELDDGTVVVKENVYREFIPPRSKTPTFLLVYKAGTHVKMTKKK